MIGSEKVLVKSGMANTHSVREQYCLRLVYSPEPRKGASSIKSKTEIANFAAEQMEPT